ncbi:MAG: beta-N-acetylhexosaminidase [Clostridia bacterium]|nr:beta-N-acetylhexosaminidase [Clostridia bacterium]
MKPTLIPQPREIICSGGASALPENASVTFVNKPELPDEAYELKIENGAAEIAASSKAGVFYAAATLSQLRANGAVGDMLIRDEPAYPYRGFLIDSCRHFYRVNELKSVIDAAARFKLNRFHWHLTDDQGWRVEIKRYPKLTEIGSRRSGSHFGGVDEGGPYVGYFTQDEIREIVDYCMERFIEVVPEIDMPGHFTAALAAFPEFGCTGEHMEPAQKEGIYPNVMCVGNDGAVAFVKNVLDEVCELFPGKYVHIGGDEAPRTRWSRCEKCNAKMKALGITDYDALQGCFIEEIAEYLVSKGKTAVTWNESLKGGRLSPEHVVVQRWMDRKNLCEAFAKKGGKVIESDFYHYYFDYPFGMTPLKKAFKYDPASKHREAGLVGVEGALWTEYVRTFDDLCEKLFPRILTVAERGWSGSPKRDYAEFRAAAESLIPFLNEQGIPALPPDRWDPAPLKRIKEVRAFFKGPLNNDLIGQMRENKK